MGPSTFGQFLATAVMSPDQSTFSSELLVIGAEGIEVKNATRISQVSKSVSNFTQRALSAAESEA